MQVFGVCRRVVEDRPETVGAGAHERLHGNLGEVATQRLDLRLPVRDLLGGRRDLALQPALLVQRRDVVLGEDVGRLLELLELVGQLLDVLALVVDRIGGNRIGAEERRAGRERCGDEQRPSAARLTEFPTRSAHDERGL